MDCEYVYNAHTYRLFIKLNDIMRLLVCTRRLYPFHHTCRGTMSRKRAMFPIIYEGCDGSKGNINCIKEFEEARRVPYVPLSKSRFLIALLDDVHFLLSFDMGIN